MKKFNILSFYYTLVIVTIIVFGSVFILPDPYKIIIPLILIPSFLFLWLNITNPEGASESTWSYRVMVVILILAALGLFGFISASKMDVYKNKQNEVSEQSQKIDELNNQINDLKDKINSLGSKQNENTATESANNSDTLGENTTNEQISDLIKYIDNTSSSSSTTSSNNTKIAGYIRVTSKSEIDVYSQNNETSRIVGIASLGKKYPFYESKGDWYMIEFDAGKNGWVMASDVVEVN
jgi:type II secretory pathway pseudopilin PulG